MMNDLPEKMILESMDVAADRVSALREVMPEVFTETGINWDALRRTLGEWVDPGRERFGLNWPGKAECMRIIQQPSVGTLLPMREKSVDFDNTENVIIQGDNLEVLKLVQKSYYGTVDVIYIDPPYNTGGDFIYPDDFTEGLQDYLRYSGQTDENQFKLTANVETDGRFHSKWLNMMYPRMFLARNLLKADGALFVSIGEHELHHLRALLNIVFGEENFLNIVSVKTKESSGASGGGEDKRLKKNVEYLLCWTKMMNEFRRTDVFRSTPLADLIAEKADEGKKFEYSRVLVSEGSRKSIGKFQDGSGQEIEMFRHEGFDIQSVATIAAADGASVDETYAKYFQRVFRTTNAQTSIRTRVQRLVGDATLTSISYRPASGRHRGKAVTKYFYGPNADLFVWLADTASLIDGEVVKETKCGTLWDDLKWTGIASEGGVDFTNGKKPLSLIGRVLDMATTTKKSALVLDFFAGSGTTGEAVLRANAADGGNRHYLLVQLPEPVDGKTVADITRERMMHSSRDESGFAGQDNGFRYYQLAASNFLAWNGSNESIDALQTRLSNTSRQYSRRPV